MVALQRLRTDVHKRLAARLNMMTIQYDAVLLVVKVLDMNDDGRHTRLAHRKRFLDRRFFIKRIVSDKQDSLKT
jgi:hypothetical protein